MRSKLIKLTLSAIVFLIFITSVVGQATPPHKNPKYGADSVSRIECAMNISLYSEFYKQKNYADALTSWRKVFNNCPGASKNTYIKGSTILKNIIIKEKDAAVKEAYIDTLMMLYDQRIEHFGQKGTVLSYKGVDLYTFRPEIARSEVYVILGEAMKESGDKTKAAVVTIYMQVAIGEYKDEIIDANKVIEEYALCMEILEAAKAYNKKLIDKGGKYQQRGEKELENIAISMDNVEALFSESSAATADALVSIFSPKFEENKENLDWIKKVNKLLNKADAVDDDFFAKTAEQQYKLEPNAEAAHNLARLFLKKQIYDKAEGYYEEATNLQEDAESKSLYYYEWSQLAFAMEKYQKVRTLSNKAIENNSTDGRPYLMIGKAYAASKKLNIGKEEVEHYTVYWAAVDAFIKAKNVDPELADEVNELVVTYSQYFPKYEQWFMAIGTNKGDSYTVGGWINVTTKVRF